jgi:prephenate dehydrogenase
MSTATPVDTTVRDALETCVGALNRLITYKLEPSLQRRLDDLGARKEFLNATEHDEMLALVDFTQHRTIEALEARLALSRLHDAFSELDGSGSDG